MLNTKSDVINIMIHRIGEFCIVYRSASEHANLHVHLSPFLSKLLTLRLQGGCNREKVHKITLEKREWSLV